MTNPQQPNHRPNYVRTPSQFAAPQSSTTQGVAEGPTGWSAGKRVLIAALVLVVVAVGTVIALVTVGRSDSESSQSVATFDPSRVGISAQLSREQEIGYSEFYLAKARDSSIQALRSMGFMISPEYSENASDKGLVDGVFVDIYSAWKLGQTDKGRADQVLRGVIDPNSNDYGRYRSGIGDGGSPILSYVGKIGGHTKNFYRSNFEGEDGTTLATANGLAMRVLTNYYQDEPTISGNGRANQVIYQQVNAVRPDGSSFKKWTVKEMVSPDNKSWHKNLSVYGSTLE